MSGKSVCACILVGFGLAAAGCGGNGETAVSAYSPVFFTTDAAWGDTVVDHVFVWQGERRYVYTFAISIPAGSPGSLEYRYTKQQMERVGDTLKVFAVSDHLLCGGENAVNLTGIRLHVRNEPPPRGQSNLELYRSDLQMIGSDDNILWFAEIGWWEKEFCKGPKGIGF